MVLPARAVTALAAAMALAAVAVFIAAVGVPPPGPASTPILASDGEPLTLADLEGPTPQSAMGTWSGRPVIVLKLDGPVQGPTLEVPGAPSQAIVVFGAKSTHLGCLVEAISEPPRAVVLRDICHHGMWDPYAGAAVLNGPAPRPLDQYAPALERLPGGGLAIEARSWPTA